MRNTRRTGMFIAVITSILTILQFVYAEDKPVEEVAKDSSNSHRLVDDPELLEEKYEALQKKQQELENTLAAASIKIDTMSNTNRLASLRSIERKAREYDAMHITMQMRNRKLQDLQAQLDKARLVNANHLKQIEELQAVTNSLTMQLISMEEQNAAQKSTLDLVRMGKYEYYEAQPGDTCESIAMQQSVYGDISKHILIRQANKGNVTDLDNLSPGEMLIIPRFDASGSYEF